MTTLFKNCGYYLMMVWLVLTAVACQKKCQAPVTEKFKTFTGQEWRLVESTNPSPEFKNLSNTTFLIWTFDKDYTGKIQKVLNNKLYDTPTHTFEYNVDPEGELLRLNVASVSAQVSEDGSTDAASSGAAIMDFDYTLTRQFELTDSKSGAYYRFVPYSGIVDPDNNCSF